MSVYFWQLFSSLIIVHVHLLISIGKVAREKIIVSIYEILFNLAKIHGGNVCDFYSNILLNKFLLILRSEKNKRLKFSKSSILWRNSTQVEVLRRKSCS